LLTLTQGNKEEVYETMKFEITILQARDESIEISGFRYVMALRHPVSTRLKAVVTESLFEMAHYFDGSLNLNNWPEIERSLARHGAWKGDIEIEEFAANQVFSRA
jgi:hypothetical protein